MYMLKFEKGNPENLEGNALVYSHNTKGAEGSLDNPFYQGLFLGIVPDDTFEVIKSYKGDPPPEMKNGIREQYSQIMESLFKKHQARKKIMEGLKYTIEGIQEQDPDIPKHMKDVIEESLEEINRYNENPPPRAACIIPAPLMADNTDLKSRISGDLMRITDTPGIKQGVPLLSGTAQLYMDTYFIQQESKIPEQEGYVSSLRNLTELSRKEFNEEFIRLTGELMYYTETTDCSETDKIFTDLKKLTKGAPFVRDIVNLYQISRTQNPDKIRLMTLYAEKILAIVDEEYLEARNKEKEISAITLQPKTEI